MPPCRAADHAQGTPASGPAAKAEMINAAMVSASVHTGPPARGGLGQQLATHRLTARVRPARVVPQTGTGGDPQPLVDGHLIVPCAPRPQRLRDPPRGGGRRPPRRGLQPDDRQPTHPGPRRQLGLRQPRGAPLRTQHHTKPGQAHAFGRRHLAQLMYPFAGARTVHAMVSHGSASHVSQGRQGVRLDRHRLTQRGERDSPSP